MVGWLGIDLQDDPHPAFSRELLETQQWRKPETIEKGDDFNWG